MSEIDFLKPIHPKKSLGQSFLIDNNILNKIIDAACVTKKDIILEIGAGSGALTSKLADNAKYVFALEIDTKLCSLLKQRVKDYKNIEVINKDILKFSFSSLKRIPKKGIKVIANIPYYISTPIIAYLLKNRKFIPHLVTRRHYTQAFLLRAGAEQERGLVRGAGFISEIYITIQKELADRIIASTGLKDYSRLSCFVQFYTEPKKLFAIKRNSFSPPPKVDSCFLRLKILKKPRFKVKDEELLFKIIRSAFQMRRKIILNSLNSLVDKDKLKDYLSKLGINSNSRAEDISLKGFVKIANSINDKQ